MTTSVRLTLSSSSPWNSNYLSDEGKIIYVVTAPFKFVGRKCTVEKVVQAPEMYEKIATIDFNYMTSSVFNFPERSVKTSDFFKKSGMSVHGRNRIFSGPDGRQYEWQLRETKPELYLHDGSNTLIAKYHRPHGGVVSTAVLGSLEVFPPGDKIMDLIVITFIYLEKLRQDRDQASYSY